MLNIFVDALTLYPTIPTTLKIKPFENIVGKGENAGNQLFLLFPQYFLPFPKQISFFQSLLFLSSSNAFVLGQSKNSLFDKELKPFPLHMHLNTLKKKSFRKTLQKIVKLLKMSDFIFFHNFFYAICIFKSLNSHI